MQGLFDLLLVIARRSTSHAPAILAVFESLALLGGSAALQASARACAELLATVRVVRTLPSSASLPLWEHTPRNRVTPRLTLPSYPFAPGASSRGS